MRKVTIDLVSYVGADDDVAAVIAAITRMRLHALGRVMEQFGAALEAVTRSIGEALLPVLREFREAWDRAV